VPKTITFPCLQARLVPTSKVVANEYNPNKVARPEMELLADSIEADGVTMPIVVYHDKEHDQYVVVDGFHRYMLLRDRYQCPEIPVTVIDKPISERMASTIRHNRARGKHQVDLMGEIVRALAAQGWADDEIAKHLGMTYEELLRLKQVVGIAKAIKYKDYGRAWEAVE
jgi:ParB-like chromosome segregation protein Spo0J